MVVRSLLPYALEVPDPDLGDLGLNRALEG
jgi:hypothetical protein